MGGTWHFLFDAVRIGVRFCVRLHLQRIAAPCRPRKRDGRRGGGSPWQGPGQGGGAPAAPSSVADAIPSLIRYLLKDAGADVDAMHTSSSTPAQTLLNYGEVASVLVKAIASESHDLLMHSVIVRTTTRSRHCCRPRTVAYSTSRDTARGTST